MDEIPDGYTRVSEILDIYKGYTHIPKTILQRAAERGTEIHSAIEAFYNNDIKYLDRTKMGYFQSFMSFEEFHGIAPVLQEERFFCDETKITGRIDLLAVIDKKPILIDFKTSSKATPEIWKLQGTFYRYLLGQNNRQVPDEYWFIQLMKDGSEPYIYRFKHMNSDDRMMFNAIEMHRYFTEFNYQNKGEFDENKTIC